MTNFAMSLSTASCRRHLFPAGKFVGQEEYENMLQRIDMTISQFEAPERGCIFIRKLYALVSSSAFVGDAEVRDEFERRNTKVKFEYAVLTQADILKGLHPTDQELKAFYDRNKANYNNSIPEKRQIKYAVVESVQNRGSDDGVAYATCSPITTSTATSIAFPSR